MSIVDDFYRRREIINVIQAWQPQPLTFSININKDVVEVGFRFGLEQKLTKDEKYRLLFIIQEELVKTCDGGELTRKLMKKLHEKLKELKDQIRKDFDIKEVKT